jgi:catechol 2,3-dioxygenase-like lactoylglutathione lyase family enzyme
MRFTIDRIDHIVLNVKDVEIAAAWYQRVLGMDREDFGREESGRHRRTALKFGGQKINLRPFDAEPGTWPTGVNDQPGAGDVCFITAAPPDEVVGHLHDCGVMVVAGPVERAGALGPIQSVYCRDPDGNLVEIASYQP